MGSVAEQGIAYAFLALFLVPCFCNGQNAINSHCICHITATGIAIVVLEIWLYCKTTDAALDIVHKLIVPRVRRSAKKYNGRHRRIISNHLGLSKFRNKRISFVDKGRNISTNRKTPIPVNPDVVSNDFQLIVFVLESNSNPSMVNSNAIVAQRAAKAK